MIELNNITTGYFKDKPLLVNYSFTYLNNTVYGILGESGCGKSTLLKSIAGLIYPLDGEIKIDGKPLKKACKNDIYMMHQNYACFDWLKCIDNITIVDKINHKKPNKEMAIQMLKKVGLEDCIDKYPSQLSGGMKQRLALARTLYVKPGIILMDEPLSALDDKTRSSMQDLIMEVHKETKNIIIMVTHSREEAEKMCDQVITLGGNQYGV